MNEDFSIGAVVRKLETDFISGGGTLMSKHVTSDLYSDINKIYAYLDSKHVSGPKDSLGREKPFFNIVVAARNIWYRATDIDRKNIMVRATKSSDVVASFLASVKLQDWMRRVNFGAFLNDWGVDLASFNSSVVKFVEAKGKLNPVVVSWGRLIVDQVNFKSNLKIETIELTEAELYQRDGYDKDMVEKLCEALSTRELTDTQKQDQKTGYIKLYEVHGLLPLAYLTGKDEDDDEFVQQMHVISFVASKEKGKYDDFTLYSGREAQDPYMLTSLLPNTDGSISLNGSVKSLFEAQWMMNDTVKSIRDQMQISSKLIFQTADTSFVGRNVLKAIEQGDILTHKENMPLTQVANTSHDITIQQNNAQMWKSLGNEIVGVSESMLGNTAPSGTAWRQVEAILQESRSLFELMTENKALHIEEMLRTFVIPFLKKQLDNSDEIVATLEDSNIKRIDSIYLPKEAIRRHNKQFKEAIIKGDIPAEFNPEQAQADISKELSPLGNQRFFTTDEASDVSWKEVFKDLEWELEVDITGEASDKQAALTTLNTALNVVANPNFVNNPQAQLIISKILSTTGIVSPIEIASLPAPVPTQAPPAVGGNVPANLIPNG